ncbi:FAR1-related sequence 5-like protein [Tanacetum coccineum]
MTQAEKMFVVKASTMKLGATRAHNLYSSMKGGAQYVHGTSDDFKNHIRDVNAFIGESDAQMLINKMENRKKFVPNFTFQYKVENSELVAMFWADEVDKCNYKEFGDIIAFDASFRTNKYDMVFVPFTGIDNHIKCVTVGSGLLLREDTKAYTWLLRSFMIAHEKQPTMIVTGLDGVIKLAIEEVLTESKHKLCMWHIMLYIPAKICTEIYDETDFKERFNKIVWNMFMEPIEFEEKLVNFIKDFGLQNQKWITKMFNLREMWLPAYFIDSPLFRLMRTTSRSESENAFFKSFINHGSTLVNFMMCFESAMERQRYRDKRASAYRTLNTEKEKEVVQKKEYVVEYKVLRSLEDGLVECTFEKPQQNDVNNPQRARNKGGRRGERRKSGREIALKAKTRQIRKCLCCGEKTNKHTNSTCPSNTKYVAKLARLVVAVAKQGTTNAAATEQATTTATIAEQGETTTAATEEATTTAIVSE